MAARYYTHFVTSAEPAHSSEWSGGIELTHPLGERRDSKELRRCWPRTSRSTPRTSRFCRSHDCTDHPESPSGLLSLHRKSAFRALSPQSLGLFLYSIPLA